MQIRVSHETRYRYATPPNGVIQSLRLTPRNHDGQYVVDWRIDVSVDSRLDRQEDAFGNIAHAFTADGPLNELVVNVEGRVETQDTDGVIRDTIERFPPSLYLRETPLTHADAGILALAEDARAAAGADDLKFLHQLAGKLHETMTYDVKPTQVTTTAAEAYTLKRGVCQDATHIFIASARSRDVPARYISGYLLREDTIQQDAGHAWAEAHVAGLGWVAFDPLNAVSATDAYVRVAVGLDYLSAAPVRGTRYGGNTEELTVKIRIDQAARQSQN